MIKLRNMACAYLFNNNEILMMKRVSNSSFLPNLWAPVGGHMEPNEINNPKAACVREVYEEIGLKENDLHNLVLKYITVRRKGNEIRVQYIYFGTALNRSITECDEGELHWIKESEILNLNMSITNTNALNHYFKKGRECSDIFVGVVDALGESSVINWTILDSFDTLY